MPELPEAETVRSQLEREIVGARIKRLQVHVARTARGHDSHAELAALVEGRRIVRVGRRGKAVLLFLNSKHPSTLIIRLGMTGLVRVVSSQEPMEKHAAAVFELADRRQIRLVDQRTFGSVAARPGHDVNAMPEFCAYGPEPFSEEFTPEYLKEAFSRRSANIESVLMNQNVIAGIGKIYADGYLLSGRSAARPVGEQAHRPDETADLGGDAGDTAQGDRPGRNFGDGRELRRCLWPARAIQEDAQGLPAHRSALPRVRRHHSPHEAAGRPRSALVPRLPEVRGAPAPAAKEPR